MRSPECRSRSEEHTSELQSQSNLVCRLLLEKKHGPAALAEAAPPVSVAGPPRSSSVSASGPSVSFLTARRPPRPPLFPYTTLFRSFAATKHVSRRGLSLTLRDHPVLHTNAIARMPI